MIRVPAPGRGFDAVALGEVMLRLDPGEGRIRSARRFDVWEGGGEYNVVRGLSSVFGLRTSVLTGLVANDVGDLLLSLIRSAGVDTSHIHLRDFDGMGRAARNALNFTERGFGLRGARGVSDRGHSAASQLHASDLDLDRLFDREGTRWLHTGGIFAGLSETTIDTTETVMRRARDTGAVVSVDFNYRPSLWPDPARAHAVYRRLARSADVLVAGESDLIERLGLPAPDQRDPVGRFAELAATLINDYPNISMVATTARVVHSASRNTWSGFAYTPETGPVASLSYPELDVLDRVGGGDAFAAGLFGALLDGASLDRAVQIGAAHGALVMTTPGDSSMASAAEVAALADGAGPGTVR